MPAETRLSAIIRRLRVLRQSAFFVNATKLLGFTVVGQIITLIAAPVLSRNFGPGDFGLFGIFVMFSGMASGLICLCYDTAIPAPHRDSDAAALAFGAGAVALVVAPLFAAFYAGLVAFNVFGYGVMPQWSSLVLGILLVVIAAASVQQYWCIRRQQFSAAGRGAVIMNVVRAAAQIGLCVIGSGWAGLAGGETIGRLGNVAYLWTRVSRDLLSYREQMSASTILDALYRYRRFALILLPAMTLDGFVGALFVPLVNVLFGVAIAGQYFLMRRVMDLPMVIVTRTVADAFYGKISEYVREGPERIRPFLLEVFLLGTGASLLLFVPLILFGPSIFAFVFGEKWRIAGLLSAIMVPAVAVNLGAAPVARVFYLTRLPQLRYVVSVLMTIGIVTLYLVAKYLHLDVIGTTIGISLVTFFAQVVYFITAYVASAHLHLDEGATENSSIAETT